MTQLVLSTEAYAGLADTMAKRLGAERGTITRKTFADGEHYQRLDDDVNGRDVVLVGGSVNDGDTLTLFDLGCAVAKYGAHTLTIVVPFFGYSTMERAVKPGEVVTAKTRARLFSAIPICGSGNRIVLFDLHAEAMTHYFEGALRQTHVSGHDLAMQLVRELGGTDPVVACTDAGRAKWVESLANHMGLRAAFVLKRRIDDRLTELAAVNAQVSGKRVVIYDDMIRTGSSLLKAAEAYRAAGATDVSAVATHGVFPEDSLQTIMKSGLVSKIACSDSHPRALQLASQGLIVKSCAELLCGALT